MSEGLKIILSLSCSGTLLMVVLYLLRPLVQARLSKQWQYYIWLVVVARLLIPFAPEANLMGMLFEQISGRSSQAELAAPTTQNSTSGRTDTTGENGGLAHNSVPKVSDQSEPMQNGYPAEGSVTNRVSAGADWASVLMRYIWILWPITALVLFIRKVTIYQSFVKYIRAGCVEVEEIELLERLGSLVAQSGVKAAVDLSTNPLISSPLLIGFFRPRIVLPTTELSDSDFQFTILHELTHFKRLDMFYKWLVQAAICVHWFNPFAYLLGHEVERACELACDEAVIRELDATGRRAYGDTLMNAIGAGGRYKDSVAAVTLCEGKERMGERLAAIAGFQKKSKLVRAFSIVLAGAIFWGAVSVGAYSAPASGTKPKTSGDLNLITAEYTIEELNAHGIKRINVSALSDEITVVQRGKTLKIEYYAANPEEYSLDQFTDALSAEEIEELHEFYTTKDLTFVNPLCLSRKKSLPVVGNRSITITVPEDYPLEGLTLINTTGNIRLENCSFPGLSITTQTGKIEIVGGTIGAGLQLQTESGDALISGTVLPIKDQGITNISTRTGFVTFQPLDNPFDYRIEVDYGDEANVMINDEYVEQSEWLDEYAVYDAENNCTAYPPEAVIRINQFNINEDGKSVIKFTSPKGTLRLLGE